MVHAKFKIFYVRWIYIIDFYIFSGIYDTYAQTKVKMERFKYFKKISALSGYNFVKQTGNIMKYKGVKILLLMLILFILIDGIITVLASRIRNTSYFRTSIINVKYLAGA